MSVEPNKVNFCPPKRNVIENNFHSEKELFGNFLFAQNLEEKKEIRIKV